MMTLIKKLNGAWYILIYLPTDTAYFFNPALQAAPEMFFIYVLRTEITLECPSGLFQNSPANEPRAI